MHETTATGAQIFTDEARAYRGLAGFRHETVNHSVGEYVRGTAHTNDVEFFWAMLKRGYHGTCHHMSRKHLGRYVGEFAGRYNVCPRGTLDRMAGMAEGMTSKRLMYRELVA